MKKIGKKHNKLNSVEAYACACLYVLPPACLCRCGCGCTPSALESKAYAANHEVNGANAFDRNNFEASVVQA